MYENEFDVHDNEHAGETDFYTNGFTQTRFHTEARGNSEIAFCASKAKNF